MKKLILLLSGLIFFFSHAALAVESRVGGGPYPGSSRHSLVEVSGEATITVAVCDRGIVNDGALTASTDTALPDVEYNTGFTIKIEDGTYSLSLTPPSGEKLRINGGFLDADDEADLTSDEGDIFYISRWYSASLSAWVWEILPITGLVSDGGVAD